MSKDFSWCFLSVFCIGLYIVLCIDFYNVGIACVWKPRRGDTLSPDITTHFCRGERPVRPCHCYTNTQATTGRPYNFTCKQTSYVLQSHTNIATWANASFAPTNSYTTQRARALGERPYKLHKHSSIILRLSVIHHLSINFIFPQTLH